MSHFMFIVEPVLRVGTIYSLNVPLQEEFGRRIWVGALSLTMSIVGNI